MSGLSDKHYAFAGNVARSLARMVLAIGIARAAGRDAFAVYVLLVAVEIVWTTVANSVYVEPMLTVSPAYPPAERDGLLRVGLEAHGWACGLTAVLGVALSPVVGWLTGVSVPMLVGFCVSAAAVSLAQGMRAACRAAFQSKMALFADGFGLGVPLAAVGWAAWTGRDPVLVYWWANAAGHLLSSGAMATRSRGMRGDAGRAPAEGLARAKAMGPPMLWGSAANQVSARAHPFVLQGLAGAVATAGFGAASTFAGPLRMLSVALGNVLRPRLALHHGAGRPHDVRRALRLALGLTLAGGAGLAGVALVFGGALAGFAFGPEFADLGPVLVAAALFATAEGCAGLSVVALQTTHADGARLATRLRVRLGALSLLLAVPAAAFGPIGTFTVLGLTELVYAGAALVPLLGSRSPSLSLRSALSN